MKPNDTVKTPKWVYEPLGRFDLDPCAGTDTNIGELNFSIDRGEDGLVLGWHGSVFCNPPFSQKDKWIEKFIHHYSRGNATGILLLPERGSAPWFSPLASLVGRYWVMGKKINFEGGPSSNNIGSVMFPFGAEALVRILNSQLPGHLCSVVHCVERTA